MKLEEFISQRSNNTIYVNPNAKEEIYIKNDHIYIKCEEIAKFLFLFYSNFNLIIINDLLHGLNIIQKPKPESWELNETLQIDELKPIIDNILKLNKELFEIIISDDNIISMQNISREEFKIVIEEQVFCYTYKLYEILLKRQKSNVITIPYELFQRVEFWDSYLIFENYIYAKQHCLKIFLEFQNLKLESSAPVVLNSNLCIKNLEVQDIFFINNCSRSFAKDPSSFRIENPVLEICFYFDKNKGFDLENKTELRKGSYHHSSTYIEQVIFDVLSILRVSNINYVGLKRIVSLTPGFGGYCIEHFTPYLYSLPFSHHKEKFFLNNDLKEKLKLLHIKYSISQNNVKLTAAIRRFNFAYERKFEEDKIIDYFISLETLLEISNRSKQEQLARKISELLGSNVIEKRKIRSKIVKYYNLRNSINHKNHEINKTMITEANEYLDNALRKLIKINLEEI